GAEGLLVSHVRRLGEGVAHDRDSIRVRRLGDIPFRSAKAGAIDPYEPSSLLPLPSCRAGLEAPSTVNVEGVEADPGEPGCTHHNLGEQERGRDPRQYQREIRRKAFPPAHWTKRACK